MLRSEASRPFAHDAQVIPAMRICTVSWFAFSLRTVLRSWTGRQPATDRQRENDQPSKNQSQSHKTCDVHNGYLLFASRTAARIHFGGGTPARRPPSIYVR